MGNKQSKEIYDQISRAFEKETTMAKSMSIQCVSEAAMIEFLSKVVSKKIKEADIQAFEKNMKLNVPAEESKEDRAAKQKRAQEARLQAALVAGHEELPEVKAIFQSVNLEDTTAPGLEDVRRYTHTTMLNFICTLLLLLEKSANKQEVASFYTRVGNYLLASQEVAKGGESSGTSTALYFAALLIDPKKLLTDPQISANILDMFRTMPSLSFYGSTRQALIIDRSIEYIKRSLLAQIEANVQSKDPIITKNLPNAIKTLCYIGLARGSMEDLLIVAQLLERTTAPIYLGDVLERVLRLPEAAAGTFSLQPEGLEFQIPFEQIYVEKTGWIIDRATLLSSATDGEFVYFYSPVHGLLALGVGKGKLKGKIYAKSGVIETKGKIQLLCVGGKLYCLTEGKIQRLNPFTLALKESKKMSQVAIEQNCLVTGNGNLVLTYRKLDSEAEESEAGAKIQAEVTIYDLSGKAAATKVSITHFVSDAQEVVACGNVLLVLGKKKCEAIDLSKNAILKSEESGILKHATLCADPNTKELYTIHFTNENDGFVLGKFEALNLKAETVPVLDAKIAEIRQLLKLDSKEEEVTPRKELAGLLGIFTEELAAPKAADPGLYGRIDLLLLILAARAKATENFVKTANIREAEQVMRVYKTPLGIHLTARCLEVQMHLATTYYAELLAAKSEDNAVNSLEKLCSILVILNEHMMALRKCNISLEDCVGPEGVAFYGKLCKEVITPVIAGTMLDKLVGAKSPELILCTKKHGEACMKNSQALAVSELEKTLQALQEMIRKTMATRKLCENFYGLSSWLDTPDNTELIASKILERNVDCIELLNMYFKLEDEYFCAKAQEFVKNEHKENDLFIAQRKLFASFTNVIERLFVLIGRSLGDKKGAAQEAVATFLPGMLHSHLKHILVEIREAYGKFREQLAGKSEELLKTKKLGPEYARFWKFVENSLQNELLLFHTISLLTAAIMGLNSVPEQLIRLSEILMKSTDELKDLLAGLAMEKEKDKAGFLLANLEETFESGAITTSSSCDKEFNFPEASAVHVYTVKDIDIPLPATNGITVTELPKNKSLVTINKAGPKYDGILKVSHIRLSAKIDYVANENDLPYKGYTIKVMPKYVYGQKILKETLRKIMWAVCYVSKAALLHFEDAGKAAGLSDRTNELMNNILSSRLLSGGLPTNYFSTLFSAQFNKQFSALKEGRNIGLEAGEEQEKESEDAFLKEIMNGGKEKTEKLIATLQQEYVKKQRLSIAPDPLAEDIVRATFALLIKITGSAADWVSVAEFGEEKPMKKLITLWNTANRMRAVFKEKRNAIPEDHKGEEYEKDIKAIVKTIKDKLELLLKFRSAAIAEQEKMQARKKIQLFKKSSEESAQAATEAEMVKERLGKWKDIQLAVTKEDTQELSLSSSAILILQSDITAAQLVTQLESYYLRATVLYNVMSLCQHAIAHIFSKRIRADVLAWIMSIFKRTTAVPWHYSQLTTSCGVSFQTLLRAAFFGVVKEVLEYVTLTHDSKELTYLMDALKWNYTATDHDYLCNCKLFSSLRGKQRPGYVTSLWGQQLDSEDQIPEMLLDTFEFIVIKITTRVMLSSAETVPAQEDPFPKLEKSRSMVDESSTTKLFSSIMETIFGEIRRAVESYESSQGIESKIVDDYAEVSKEEKKKEKDDEDTRKDKAKIMKEFNDTCNTIYSHEFCVRLLRLLYHLCLAVQENQQLKVTINLLTQSQDFAQLLRLLSVGSVQQQYIILQTLPLISKLSHENLEAAAAKILAEQKLTRFTRSGLLDLLLTFVLERREGIWFAEAHVGNGAYGATKAALNSVKTLISQNKEIAGLFAGLLQTILFGGKDEWQNLPTECKNRRFIELMLSVAGGEAEGLFKGAKGSVQSKKGYVAVCFDNSKDKLPIKDWEYACKKHDEVMVHLAGDEASTGETALAKIAISEFVPHADELPLQSLLQNVKPEQVSTILKKSILDPLPESPLLATIQVKLLKVMWKLLKQDKELAKKVLNPELVTLLLTEGMKGPKSSLNRSLLTTELLAEEMRKIASQSEGKALATSEAVALMLKVEKNELLMCMRSGSVCIPLIAHRLAKKLQGNSFEYTVYRKDIPDTEVSGKLVFIKEADLETADFATLEKRAKGIIMTGALEKLGERNVPGFQISRRHMDSLEAYKQKLAEIDKFMQGTKLDQVIADYLNIKPDKPIDAANVRDILKVLIPGGKPKAKEEAEAKKEEEARKDPLSLFTQQTAKCDKMFKDKQDSLITEEREALKKEFATGYPKLYERAEFTTPDQYLTILSDLRLFYTRHLLLSLLISNPGTLPESAAKDLTSFVLSVSIEADYLLHGCGYKGLSRKVNKLLHVLVSLKDSAAQFFGWVNEKVKAVAAEKATVSSTLFSVTSEELIRTIYVRFIHRYFKALAKFQPKNVVTSPSLEDFMASLLTLVAIVENTADKYRCLMGIKSAVSIAQSLQGELSVAEINKVLANKCMKALSTYCRDSDFSGSMLWKNANEITLKANALYRFSLSKFGEEAITYCVNDDENLYTAAEIMRTFPDMKKLMVYVWTRLYHKELKVKNEVRIDTPKPLYNTQYCLLIQDPIAQAMDINAKKQSASVGILSLDKGMKARLATLDEEEETFSVEFNRFYLNYPMNHYALYGFGSNDGGRLGLKDMKNVVEPKILPRLGSSKIVGVYSAASHTFVVDSKNAMYCTGKGDGRLGGENTTFNEYTTKGRSNIMATNNASTIIYDSGENQMYVIGKNPDRMFTMSSNHLANEEQVHPSAAGLKQISISATHSLLLYGDKQVFAAPESKKELFGSWVEGTDSQFNVVKLEEHIAKIHKVLALSTGSLLLCTDSKTNKREIYSFGQPSPALGQGANPGTDQYRRLDYPEDIEFVDLVGCENMAAAVTSKGELFTWGKGGKGMLALFNPEGTAAIDEVNKPTKVAALDKYSVISVAVGYNHMLVLADQKDSGKRVVLGFGDNSKGQLGEKDLNATKSELTFFADKTPYMVCVGHSCSFVVCGQKKKGIVHSGTKCLIHKSDIGEILYLSKTSAGFQYWCKECREHLPKLTMATRNPVSRLEEKPWPLLDKIEIKEAELVPTDCTACGAKEIKGTVYMSAVKEVVSTLCESCFMKTPTTFVPAIYYRLSQPFAAGKTLPTFSLNEFYETTNDYLSLILTPKYKLELPAVGIDKSVKPTLEEFVDEGKGFEKEHDLDIVDVLNDYLVEKDKEIEKTSLKKDLPVTFGKKSNLSKFSEDLLKRRLKVLIKLNKILQNAIKFIDFETKARNEEDLYNYYTKVKDFVATKTKDLITKQVVNNAPRTKGKTECLLDRHKAHLLKTSGAVDHTGERSLFGQLWRLLKDKVGQFRKRLKKDKFPFKAKFKGEGGIDAGGLFRETIDQICEELQSASLPLLVPTPNNKTAYGEYREKWTISPSASQPHHLEMLEFFGALLGMSFRLGHLLPLNMASTFWKQLMGDPVDRTDLKAIDTYCVQCLDDITNINQKGIDASTFETVVDNTFVTRLSDGSEVELKKNGKETRVTFENRHEYASLVEKARLEECSVQMKAIRTGMARVISLSLIKLYSWRELEIKICGKPTFKVEALKKITKYSGCSEKDSFIQYFWQALEEFTDEERSLYLRFVWGRSRIPTYSEKYTHSIHVKRGGRPDDTLPESHTCSFQIDLPPYTSVEKAKEKLRYAIRFCKSIETDENVVVAWEE